MEILEVKVKPDWENKKRVLKHLEDVNDQCKKNGFYAFYSGERITYVGESVEVIRRLRAHHNILAGKEYCESIDRIRLFIPEEEEVCLLNNRKIIEGYVISLMKPRYNTKDKFLLTEDSTIKEVAWELIQCIRLQFNEGDIYEFRQHSHIFNDSYIFAGKRNINEYDKKLAEKKAREEKLKAWREKRKLEEEEREKWLKGLAEQRKIASQWMKLYTGPENV